MSTSKSNSKTRSPNDIKTMFCFKKKKSGFAILQFCCLGLPPGTTGMYHHTQLFLLSLAMLLKLSGAWDLLASVSSSSRGYRSMPPCLPFRLDQILNPGSHMFSACGAWHLSREHHHNWAKTISFLPVCTWWNSTTSYMHIIIKIRKYYLHS